MPLLRRLIPRADVVILIGTTPGKPVNIILRGAQTSGRSGRIETENPAAAAAEEFVLPKPATAAAGLRLKTPAAACVRAINVRFPGMRTKKVEESSEF